MLQGNPAISSVIYNAAYSSANRNAYLIIRKLGMPPDYFWKFEYWSKERSLDTFRRVMNRVFSSMMGKNNEGSLDVQDVDVERIRFTLSFQDCAECAGIRSETGICYYHAATFTGIISALINRNLDGYETDCQAKGDGGCKFIVGKREDPEIAKALAGYFKTGNISTGINERLGQSLQGHSVRRMGNLVNIGYYQLVLLNSLITNPRLFSSSSFDVGADFGMALGPAIAGFYSSNDLSVLKKYYGQMHHLDVDTETDGENVKLIITECAELTAMIQRKEILSFLLGELQGIVSQLLKKKMSYKDSFFEVQSLVVLLAPQV